MKQSQTKKDSLEFVIVNGSVVPTKTAKVADMTKVNGMIVSFDTISSAENYLHPDLDLKALTITDPDFTENPISRKRNSKGVYNIAIEIVGDQRAIEKLKKRFRNYTESKTSLKVNDKSRNAVINNIRKAGLTVVSKNSILYVQHNI